MTERDIYPVTGKICTHFVSTKYIFMMIICTTEKRPKLDNKQQQIHNDLFFSNEFNLNQSRRTSPGCESPTHLCDSLLSRMQIYKGIGSYFWTSREIQRNKYGSLLMDFPMSYRFLITDRSGSSPSRESFFGGYYIVAYFQIRIADQPPAIFFAPTTRKNKHNIF